MHNPASDNRALADPSGARQALRPPRRIAIASGKGGVGKTWFAITLAHALARGGARVLLFDGDLGLANIDIQLGLCPLHDLSGVLAGRVGLSAACHHLAAAGFDVLPGRSGSGVLASVPPPRLEWLLDGLASLGHDVLIMDLGAGLDRATRRLAAWADTLLVVATDEPTSLTDAYAVLKLHAADQGSADVRVVINQAASAAAGQRTFATLERACVQFLGRAPVLAGVIRRDERVRDAIRRQTPLLTRHPACAAAEDVERVSKSLFS
jgi:flagellar biosynthesis protein FlhG